MILQENQKTTCSVRHVFVLKTIIITTIIIYIYTYTHTHIYIHNKILFCKVTYNSKYSSLQFEIPPLGEYQRHFYYNETSLYLSFSFRPLYIYCLRLSSIRHNVCSDHIRRYFLAG